MTIIACVYLSKPMHACTPPAIICMAIYVTRFWKISLDVTFDNLNIYEQIEEKRHPTNFAVVVVQTLNYQKSYEIL